METIMIVEDDASIRQLLALSLGNEYQVKQFEDGQAAADWLEDHRPDACVLDIMLPKKTGYEILQTIRENKRLEDLPVLILSAKVTEGDRVLGLDMGADDYMVKPFSVIELQARIRSMLRRRVKAPEILSYRELKLDPVQRIVKVGDKEPSLTYKEFELLRYLMSNPNRALEREELIHKVWGYDFIGESRTLDVHINSLRRKLGKEYAGCIQSVRQVGYKFQELDDRA